MGSAGTGRFSDYPGTPRGSAKNGGGGGGGGKGSAEVDQCERILANVTLEDVGRSDYFSQNQVMPLVGMPVAVKPTLVGGRLGVEAEEDRLLVGLLPTEYNYLLQCMKQGYTYAGMVKSVRAQPVPVVRVDLEPRK